MSEYVSNRVALDIVEHNGVQYRVSTINRESSAMYGGMYAETIVFSVPHNEILAQDEAPEGSTLGHQRMCEAFRKYGKVPEND